MGVPDGFLISLPTRKAKYLVMSHLDTFFLEYKLGIKELEDEVHPSEGDIGKASGRNLQRSNGVLMTRLKSVRVD